VSALVLGLSEDELAHKVPACPDWSVRDLFAHIIGIAADVVTGNLADVGKQDWTQAQVDARRDKSLDELVAEYESHGYQIDPVIDNFHPAMSGMLIADTVTHEQDLRGAVDRLGARSGPAVDIAVNTYARFFGRRIKDADLSALHVTAGEQSWDLGNGEPQGGLEAEPYELMRGLIGRRTKEEILAMNWSADPAIYLDIFSIYEPPKSSLNE
jgi:uncharacterized protein (TIGR03083 family)